MTPERTKLVAWATSLNETEHTPNRTHCSARVAEYLNVKARFLHTLEDLTRAIRRHGKYSLHNYAKKLPVMVIGTNENARCLEKIREYILDMNDPYAQNMWLIRWVNSQNEGHVLLVDTWGETLVDTSPGEEQNYVTDLYRLRRNRD